MRAVSAFSILAIAASALISGCGGGSSSSDSGSGTTTAPNANTNPVASNPPAETYTKNLANSYEASRTAIWVAEPESSCLAVGYADFDGDGREDYVCGTVTQTTASAPIKIYSRGPSGENWSEITSTVFSGPVMETVHARKVAIADFNGDGKPDLLIADHGYDQSPFPGAPLRLALSQADGKLKVVDMSAFGSGFHHAAAAADINGDGFVDIVATDNFHGGALILMNDGKGNFTADATRLPGTFTSGPGRMAFTTELIDVDGDGFADLLIGGHDDQSSATLPPTIYWNDGSGHFAEAASTVLPYPAGYGVTLDFDVADLDGDGKKEVVMNHTTLNPFYSGFRWSVIAMNGHAATDASARWFGSVFDNGLGQCANDCYSADKAWTKWLRLVDHDGDGKIDLLVTDKGRNLWFKNTGTTLVKQ